MENENSNLNSDYSEKDNEKVQDNTSEIIPEEVLEAIPEEERGRFKSFISQTMISGVMKRNNSISDKITTDHITRLIDNADIQDKRDRDERKSEKNYQLIFLIIALLFLGFLIVFLKDNQELLYKIIIAIISFVGGFGLGKTSKTQKNES